MTSEAEIYLSSLITLSDVVRLELGLRTLGLLPVADRGRRAVVLALALRVRAERHVPVGHDRGFRTPLPLHSCLWPHLKSLKSA